MSTNETDEESYENDADNEDENDVDEDGDSERDDEIVTTSDEVYFYEGKEIVEVKKHESYDYDNGSIFRRSFSSKHALPFSKEYVGMDKKYDVREVCDFFIKDNMNYFLLSFEYKIGGAVLFFSVMVTIPCLTNLVLGRGKCSLFSESEMKFYLYKSFVKKIGEPEKIFVDSDVPYIFREKYSKSCYALNINMCLDSQMSVKELLPHTLSTHKIELCGTFLFENFYILKDMCGMTFQDETLLDGYVGYFVA